MIVYVLVAISPFIFLYSYREINIRALYLLLLFFFCFGYMVGSDWRAYEEFYEKLTKENYVFYALYYEPGFVLYTLLFKCIGFSFWFYTILTKVISFTILYSFLYKMSNQRTFKFALFFFVAMYCCYLYIDAPFRNIIAITIFYISFNFLLKGETVKFILCTFLAMLFHTSAIFMLIIYFFRRSDFSQKKILGMYGLFLFFSIYPNVIFGILLFILQPIPYLYNKILIYSNENISMGMSLGLIINIIMSFLLIFSKRNIVKKCADNSAILCNLGILYSFVYLCALNIEIFYRFQLYLAPVYSVCIVNIVVNLTPKSTTVYKLLIFSFALLSLLSSITSAYKYIPYSNILPYVIEGSYPSYEYRDEYNKKNSPYEGLK